MRTKILPHLAVAILAGVTGCDQSNEPNKPTASAEASTPESTLPPQEHVSKAPTPSTSATVGSALPRIVNGIPFIQWDTALGGNGHYYGLTDSTMDWTAAENLARTLGGHLVSINSAAEQAFIETKLLTGANEKTIAWIGLNDAAVKGTYVWTTGEPVSLLNWAPGEPNHGGNVLIENCVAMNYYHNQNGDTKGKWIDAPNNGVPNAGTATGPYRGLIELPEAPATSTSANRVAPAPELAPEGVFFLTRRISAQSDSGVSSIAPGTIVRRLQDQGSTILGETSDSQQFTIPKDALTNDLGRARTLAAGEQAARLSAAAEMQRQRALADRIEKEKRRIGDQQVAETRDSLSSRSSAPLGSGWDNPLNATAHGQTSTIRPGGRAIAMEKIEAAQQQQKIADAEREREKGQKERELNQQIITQLQQERQHLPVTSAESARIDKEIQSRRELLKLQN